MPSLMLRRSDDGRIISQVYDAGGYGAYCLAEQTRNGILITEFSVNSEVNNQIVRKGGDAAKALASYANTDSFEMVECGRYNGITIREGCTKCSNRELLRDLDGSAPSKITDVPVIPIFRCSRCGARHYSLTGRYLERLVKSNTRLFEDAELKEMDSDSEGLMDTLQEYVIRIFASKKIYRIKSGK